MRLSLRFSAPWWAWLLTAVLVALFLRLGFWQMHRAEEKKGKERINYPHVTGTGYEVTEGKTVPPKLAPAGTKA